LCCVFPIARITPSRSVSAISHFLKMQGDSKRTPPDLNHSGFESVNTLASPCKT
jgi:hypothetical protein